MGSARINAVRQRLGLRADTFSKTISGPAQKDIGKFKSKQKPRRDPALDEYKKENLGNVPGKPWERFRETKRIPASRLEYTTAYSRDEIHPKPTQVFGTPYDPSIYNPDPSDVYDSGSALADQIHESWQPYSNQPEMYEEEILSTQDLETGEVEEEVRNIDKLAVITKRNAERWAKSARIQMARERIEAI